MEFIATTTKGVRRHQHQFPAEDLADARHWAINHLNTSLDWTIYRVYTAKVRWLSGIITENVPVSTDKEIDNPLVNCYGDTLTDAQRQRYVDLDNRIKQRAEAGLVIDESDLNLRHEALIMPTLTKVQS